MKGWVVNTVQSAFAELKQEDIVIQHNDRSLKFRLGRWIERHDKGYCYDN